MLHNIGIIEPLKDKLHIRMSNLLPFHIHYQYEFCLDLCKYESRVFPMFQ